MMKQVSGLGVSAANTNYSRSGMNHPGAGTTSGSCSGAGSSAAAGALAPPSPWPFPSPGEVLSSSSSVGTAEPQALCSPRSSGTMLGACLAWWDIVMDLLDGTRKIGERISSWDVLQGGVSGLALGHPELMQFCDSSICRCWILLVLKEAEGFNNPKSDKIPAGVKRAVVSASLRKAPKQGPQGRGELERQLKMPSSSAVCSHAAHIVGCPPVLGFKMSTWCFGGAEPRYLLRDWTAASQLVPALS